MGSSLEGFGASDFAGLLRCHGVARYLTGVRCFLAWNCVAIRVYIRVDELDSNYGVVHFGFPGDLLAFPIP